MERLDVGSGLDGDMGVSSGTCAPLSCSILIRSLVVVALGSVQLVKVVPTETTRTSIIFVEWRR